MRYVYILKSKAGLFAFAAGAICLLGTAVKAHHGGADPYHYSAMTPNTIAFSVAGQPWTAVRSPDTVSNPDRALAYFCQQFGFYNCQVLGPTDTWVRSQGECWAGAAGVGVKATVTSAWSRQLAAVSCPANKPNLSVQRVQVASIPFEF